MHNRRVNP